MIDVGVGVKWFYLTREGELAVGHRSLGAGLWSLFYGTKACTTMYVYPLSPLLTDPISLYFSLFLLEF